jgi:hypothetical protein
MPYQNPYRVHDEEHDGMALFDNESEVSMRGASQAAGHSSRGLFRGRPPCGKSPQNENNESSSAATRKRNTRLYNTDDDAEDDKAADADIELCGWRGDDDDGSPPTWTLPTIGQLPLVLS